MLSMSVVYFNRRVSRDWWLTTALIPIEAPVIIIHLRLSNFRINHYCLRNVYTTLCISHSLTRIELIYQYERKSSDLFPRFCLTSRQPHSPNWGHQLNQPATSSGRLIADRSKANNLQKAWLVVTWISLLFRCLSHVRISERKCPEAE